MPGMHDHTLPPNKHPLHPCEHPKGSASHTDLCIRKPDISAQDRTDHAVLPLDMPQAPRYLLRLYNTNKYIYAQVLCPFSRQLVLGASSIERDLRTTLSKTANIEARRRWPVRITCHSFLPTWS